MITESTLARTKQSKQSKRSNKFIQAICILSLIMNVQFFLVQQKGFFASCRGNYEKDEPLQQEKTTVSSLFSSVRGGGDDGDGDDDYYDDDDNDNDSQSELNENPHQNGWCPYARCQNSPLCQPCRRRFLIVLATARSGSTTVMKMLDQLPLVRMSGENNNQLWFLYQLVNNFFRSKVMMKVSKRGIREVKGPWQRNVIPGGSFSCNSQQHIEMLTPPTRDILFDSKLLREDYEHTIIGFKTIRFHWGNWTVKQATRFLVEHFPCSRVVVNIRSDTEAQYQSQKSLLGRRKDFDKKYPGSEENEEANRFLLDVADELGEDRTYVLDMTQWSKSDEKGVRIFNDVAKWLGYRNCRFKQVFHEHKEELDMELGKYCHLDKSKN